MERETRASLGDLKRAMTAKAKENVLNGKEKRSKLNKMMLLPKPQSSATEGSALGKHPSCLGKSSGHPTGTSTSIVKGRFIWLNKVEKNEKKVLSFYQL